MLYVICYMISDWSIKNIIFYHRVAIKYHIKTKP